MHREITPTTPMTEGSSTVHIEEWLADYRAHVRIEKLISANVPSATAKRAV
jgi:hypothetical protein